MKLHRILIGVVAVVVLGGTALTVRAQTEVAPIAARNTGREYPKSGVFTEGGAGDIASARTYCISMIDGNWQAFDSVLLEQRLAASLSEHGFVAQRVAHDHEADLVIEVRIDPIAGEHGAGIDASVLANPHRITTTKHQLAYSFSGVAPTQEDALAKFAKALTKGVHGVKPGEPK